MTSSAEDLDVGLRFGGAIRARRHLLGLTLVDVATQPGLSHPFLSQLERGLARPSMRSLTAIASTLGTTAQALMAASELSVRPCIGAPRVFDEFCRHDEREFGYVVRGRIEVDIEGERYAAAAGDSVYYAGGLRHRWRSVSDEDVQLVVVQQNRPPRGSHR